MKRFLYWCKNVNNGSHYHFASEAFLEPGIIVKNEDNEDCIIVDIAEDQVVSAYELYTVNELRRMM